MGINARTFENNLLLKSYEWNYSRSVLSIHKMVGGTEFMIIA